MADVEQPGILENLKRRSVFRVGAMYVVAAWVLLQVADVLADPFSFPDWFQTTLTGLLVIGFPITLLLAWIFDVTPDGIVRSNEDSRMELDRLRRGHKIDYAIIGTLVIALALAYLREPEHVDSRSSPETPPSIAVLPFANMSNDPDQEYFSDGIAEDILNALVRNTRMKVIARTSSFQFKGKNQDIREIGAKLNVTHILEGSVRKVGNRIRVTAQLNSTADGAHLWSDQYDRELTDVFEVQDEITATILKELQAQITGTSVKPQRTSNMEAYNALLRYRFHFGRMEMSDAMEAARRATLLDPDYADAWGSLARAQNLQMIMGGFDTYTINDYIDRRIEVKRSIQKALALNPDQGEALAMQVWLLFYEEHRHQEALDRAISLIEQNPGNVSLLGTLSSLINSLGMPDLVIEICDRWAVLDPLSVLPAISKLPSLRDLGRFPEARESLERAESNGYPMAEFRYMELFRDQGDLDGMKKMLSRIEDRFGKDFSAYPPWEAQIARMERDEERVERILASLREPAAYLRQAFTHRALIAFIDGNLEEEIKYNRLTYLYMTAFYLRSALFFKNRRPEYYNHPKYLELLKEVRLDDESVAQLKIPSLPF